jgi:hypothetical protein
LPFKRNLQRYTVGEMTEFLNKNGVTVTVGLCTLI